MRLAGRVVAVLLEKDFQDLEVWYPALRLKEEGARVVFVAPEKKEYRGKFGYPAVADKAISEVKSKDFDGVVVPGGWAPDFLRRHEPILQFVRDLDGRGCPVAAICHAGWVLASAGILKERTATSFFAIKDDVRNAGAQWVDQEFAVDGNLLTSRTPDDLPAFCRELISLLERVKPVGK
ncbi:MAG: type 1 glutamine amidotransferase [Elusimicrobia bacterium]|nr:type 1 glutamine amidotransferase [Elusimicrobiota bacterium]